MKIDFMALQESKIHDGCDLMMEGFRLISKVKQYGDGYLIATAPRMINQIFRFKKISEALCHTSQGVAIEEIFQSKS